jgi:hypothetical protein
MVPPSRSSSTVDLAAITIFAPDVASFNAIAFPIPRVAPVIKTVLLLKFINSEDDHVSPKAWHEVCDCIPKDNTMSSNTDSYFVFQLAKPKGSTPNPPPEMPPVEPSPIPPVTDPVPTVPPVRGMHFQFYPYILS